MTIFSCVQVETSSNDGSFVGNYFFLSWNNLKSRRIEHDVSAIVLQGVIHADLGIGMLMFMAVRMYVHIYLIFSIYAFLDVSAPALKGHSFPC